MPPGSAGPSPIGNELGSGKMSSKGDGTMVETCMSALLTPQPIKEPQAGLHGKLQPASDRRITVVTPSPRRCAVDEY